MIDSYGGVVQAHQVVEMAITLVKYPPEMKLLNEKSSIREAQGKASSFNLGLKYYYKGPASK